MMDLPPYNLTGVSDMISNRRFRVARMKLTPLNIATTAAWKACKKAGTHVSGDEVTLVRPARNNYAAPFSVCGTCGVPIEATIVWRIKKGVAA